MKRILTWIWMLNKRLFCKPTFLVILLLIPLLVFCYCQIAKQESGLITVVLAQEGQDALAEQVIDSLIGSSQLILFRESDSAEDATEQVAMGKADAAWIFGKDLVERITAFVSDPQRNGAFIRVVQREEKVMLMLTRELLGGKVLDLCSEQLFLQYIRKEIPEMAELSDQNLLHYYDTTNLTGELFSFEQTDGTIIDTETAEGYLMTPIRGILAVVIVLCGLATAMYHCRDRQVGTFSWLPAHLLPGVELCCQLVSTVDIGIVALISLICAGISGLLWQELLLTVLYALCVAVFSMMVRRACGSIPVLGVLLPLLVVMMLLVCPVFFDLGVLRTVQLLFPPTYYINAMYNEKYFLYMAGYMGVCAGSYWLLGKVLKRD